MRVHVRLFAVMAQDAGTGRVDLDLSRGAGVASVREELQRRFPKLRWPRGTMWAVNQEYAASEQEPLKEGDEVAIIPPVSGG
ncbi:MAG TPA: MoaD/ThiS family protein [Phycisphaerae bacterium]|nr:MoaD/ThiS family protein [Phycisphaerae bacterium]